MNLKARLMTAISMFALVFCVLIVGVWALKTTDFSVGGSINFYAKGIQATISKGVLSSTGSWKTPSDATTKMPEVKINTSKTQDQLDAEFENWTGLSLLFNESGDDVTITFSITNDASYTDKALAVNVTTTSTLENATLAINKNSAQIASGKSQEFVITFHVTEKTANAKISAFSINFDLQLVDFVITDESEVSYLTFSYDHDNLTASVTKCAATATAEIPERVRHTYTSNGQEVTAVYEVTSIADSTSSSTGAFYATRSVLTSVSFPSTLTSIGSNAFYNCIRLTGVTIPDSVTSIGESAFQGCSGLTSVSIPDSVTSIGEFAFIRCSALTFSATENGANYLGNTNNPYLVLHSATSTSITSCTINSKCKFIYDSAFESCESLTNITIPEGVISVGYCAFTNCSDLVEVTIPNTILSIGESAFAICISLTNITIPGSVTSIGANAFDCCDGLTNVTIGSGVTNLSDEMFLGCSNLVSVVVPESLISIGSAVFADCEKLSFIYYRGDQEQWGLIEIGEQNDILDNVNITYNYTGT